MTKRSGSYARAAMALALVVGSGACMSALKTALGLAGADGSPPPGSSVEAPSRAKFPSRTATPSPAVAPARPSGSTTTYSVVPTERWRLAMGRPALGLQGMASGNPCLPTPTGLSEVLAIPGDTPMVPLADYGPFELSLYARNMRVEGPGGISNGPGTYASPGTGCGDMPAIGLRLGIGGATRPVSVLR